VRIVDRSRCGISPADLMVAKVAPPSGAWDHGGVRHLPPTVSHDGVLIKASLRMPLLEAPTLHTAARRRAAV